MSLLNRLRILPEGVESKNDTAPRIIEENMELCRRVHAFSETCRILSIRKKLSGYERMYLDEDHGFEKTGEEEDDDGYAVDKRVVACVRPIGQTSVRDETLHAIHFNNLKR